MLLKSFTDEEKQDLIKKYLSDDYRIKDLAKEFNISVVTIINYVKAMGIYKKPNLSKSNRTYYINDNYFDNIDNENKAYFLGFLYADGCNYAKRNSVIWTIQEEDVEILNIFNNELESNRPLRYLNRNSKNQALKNLYAIEIHNKKISQKLIELGCWPNKSLTLEFPTEDQVPSHLIRHFIRGYFDGDGSCFIIKKKNKNRFVVGATIVSTLNFCNVLEKIIYNEVGINCFLDIRFKERDTSTRQMMIGGNLQVCNFLEWLYKDATIYLPRKFNKFKHMKDILLESSKEKYIDYTKTPVDFIFDTLEKNQKFKYENETGELIEYIKITSTEALNLETNKREFFHNENIIHDQ